MAILETLALGVGTTIAKTILSQWLQDNGFTASEKIQRRLGVLRLICPGQYVR